MKKCKAFIEMKIRGTREIEVPDDVLPDDLWGYLENEISGISTNEMDISDMPEVELEDYEEMEEEDGNKE